MGRINGHPHGTFLTTLPISKFAILAVQHVNSLQPLWVSVDNLLHREMKFMTPEQQDILKPLEEEFRYNLEKISLIHQPIDLGGAEVQIPGKKPVLKGFVLGNEFQRSTDRINSKEGTKNQYCSRAYPWGQLSRCAGLGREYTALKFDTRPDETQLAISRRITKSASFTAMSVMNASSATNGNWPDWFRPTTPLVSIRLQNRLSGTFTVRNFRTPQANLYEELSAVNLSGGANGLRQLKGPSHDAVTNLLHKGLNAIGALKCWNYLPQNWNYYGDRQSMLLKLVVTYKDGSQEVITNRTNGKFWLTEPWR